MNSTTKPTVITATRAGAASFRELWSSRELLRFLAWRDLKVRYKQTGFGAAWAIIQPVVAMIIFTFVFGRLAKVPSDDLPYATFAYTALVPWTYFSVTIATAANSLVESRTLITKVYFPRALVPAASALANLVDLAIAGLVLVVLVIVQGVGVAATIVVLPALLIALVMTTLAVGMFLAALNVRYRDVRYALPFIVQVWLFASPIAYPSSLLAPRWRPVYGLNPMSGLIEGFRWSLLGAPFPGAQLFVSLGVAVFALVLSALYFNRVESTFADVV